MPIKTPPLFIFLDPVDRPSAGKSAKVRKEVRSHVTAQQHRSRKLEETLAVQALRAGRREKLKREGKEQELEVEDKQRLKGQGEGEDEEDEEGQEEDGRRIERRETSKSQEPDAQRNARDETKDQFLSVVTSSSDLFHPLATDFSSGSLAFQLYILNDPSKSIGNILHDLGLDAFFLVDIHQTDALSQAQKWEQKYIPLTKPGTAASYLPGSIFADPTLAASAILLGLALLTRRSHHPTISNINKGILRLRGHVLRSINEALDDISRAASDSIIVAVLLLTTAEALQGLKESCAVHMAGVMEMVNFRGGLRELGFGGCLEAYLLWQDATIAGIIEGKTFSHLAKNPTPLLKGKISAVTVLDEG